MMLDGSIWFYLKLSKGNLIFIAERGRIELSVNSSTGICHQCNVRMVKWRLDLTLNFIHLFFFHKTAYCLSSNLLRLGRGIKSLKSIFYCNVAPDFIITWTCTDCSLHPQNTLILHIGRKTLMIVRFIIKEINIVINLFWVVNIYFMYIHYINETKFNVKRCRKISKKTYCWWSKQCANPCADNSFIKGSNHFNESLLFLDIYIYGKMQGCLFFFFSFLFWYKKKTTFTYLTL